MRLEANRIAAGYSELNVLSDVSIALKTGEMCGLIGPNGSGKSTVLRCLSGALRLRAGAVTLDGVPLSKLSPRDIALKIAFVPQTEPSQFDFTVRDLVLMGRHAHIARWSGETAADYQIVARALADTDLLHLADRVVTRLSGGEHRRVLIARALAQQAPLMLLDEPTAHLDVTHQVELLSLVRRHVRESGGGVVVALHDLNQAAEFCDRLVLIFQGAVAADGPPAEVLTEQNIRTAYGACAQIGRNPATGRPQILQIQSVRERSISGAAHRIHLIGGGGAGIEAMGSLLRAGHHVTAGALNRLDSDHTAALTFGIEVAEETPFRAIGPGAMERCRALIADADTVLIAEAPFGPGNLANLELAREAQTARKQVILLGRLPFDQRDFAGGRALALLQALRDAGAQQYETADTWIASLTESEGGQQ